MADEDEVISDQLIIGFILNNDDEEVFVYMGGDMVVPDVVVRARVHPSVTEIPAGLTGVSNVNAFYACGSLKHVNIPSTVKTIGSFAFCGAPLRSLHLPDSIESIGDHAFCHGQFPTVRIPPLITTINDGVFLNCSSMFSAELPETITQMVEGLRFEGGRDGGVFDNCRSLRNVAVPLHAVVGVNTFKDCTDLLQLFGSESQIINALKHRFDNLPIHKMIYYHSYNNLTSEQLRNAINISSRQPGTSRSNLSPTGNQQDCLGMTPLHILACSTVHHLELYQVLIEKYPENLITEDRWGTVPLLYAVWGNAPSEIVQLLVEKYLSIYPDHELDWTKMITTLGVRSAPESSIQSLLNLQKVSFPAQKIDWDRVLNTVANTEPLHSNPIHDKPLKSTLRFLVKISISTRVDAIGLKLWRDDMSKMMTKQIPLKQSKRVWLSDAKSKLSYYEDEYQQLKEATTTLELALWKTKLDGLGKGGIAMSNKKRKHDGSDIRSRCRISSGADIVIQHVLSYLVVPPPEDCHSDEEDNDSSSQESGDDMDSESDDSSSEESSEGMNSDSDDSSSGESDDMDNESV